MKIYEYSGCSTCKKALKFLKDRGVQFEQIPIVETPPSKAELKKMLGYLRQRGGDLNKLFNTSGVLYREMKVSERLKGGMTENEALDLLAANGKLIKRPFLLTDKSGAVGFKEDDWKALLDA